MTSGSWKKCRTLRNDTINKKGPTVPESRGHSMCELHPAATRDALTTVFDN